MMVYWAGLGRIDMGRISNQQTVVPQKQNNTNPSIVSQFVKVLSGKKTYLVSLVMIVYAISGYYAHQVDQNTMWLYIFNALGFSGLRSGIASLNL